MMYIPKNKISPNQHTNGKEYQYSSGEEYVGYYYKIYNGKVFVGKNPSDEPVETELFPYEEPLIQSKVSNKSFTPSFTEIEGPPYPSGFDDSEIDIQLNQSYMYTKYSKLQTKVYNLPTQFFPKPSNGDYKLGVFVRYFCVKNNEDVYFELDKTTFDALNSKKKDWAWEMYSPFSILWTIKGIKEQVEKTNYNMIMLQESRMKRTGLKSFLKNDYLKFYLE